MTPEEKAAAEAAKREAEQDGVTGVLKAVNESLERVQGKLEDADNKAEAQVERIAALEKSFRKNEDLGLSAKELSTFSIGRAMCGIKYGEWGNGPSLEREAMEAAKDKRAQSTASNAAGGFLLPNEVSNQIIAPLKAKAVVGAAGATFLEGLSGTVDLPKAAVAELQSRSDAAAVSDQSANWTYSEVSLTGAYSGEMVKVSRSLLQQANPSIDAFINTQMMEAARRRVDVLALAEVQGLTATADAIAAIAVAGDKLSPQMLHRAWTLLQAANALDDGGQPAFIANPLVKWHVLNGAAYGAGAPWLPFATDAALGQALGASVHSTTVFNDDTGINGEAVLGNFSKMVVGLFGEGIEIASSEHSSFANNLVDFRVLLSADAVLTQDAAFIHWDTAGDA